MSSGSLFEEKTPEGGQWELVLLWALIAPGPEEHLRIQASHVDTVYHLI